MIIAGGIGGWKAGKPFDFHGLAALAIFAVFLNALVYLLLSGVVSYSPSDIPLFLLDWLLLFLWGAVPFVLMGLLKMKRDTNREGE